MVVCPSQTFLLHRACVWDSPWSNVSLFLWLSQALVQSIPGTDCAELAAHSIWFPVRNLYLPQSIP